METPSALGKPDCEPLQNTENNTQMVSYSLRACGSFCICSKIMRMAGSLMICCTSGSAMALRFTSSGLSLRIAWLTIQRCRPSVASCSDRGIEKYNVNMSGHHLQHNPPRKLEIMKQVMYTFELESSSRAFWYTSIALEKSFIASSAAPLRV